MIHLPDYIDPECLRIRNFPADFRRIECRQFLEMFGAASVTILGSTKSTVLAHFPSAAGARDVLRFLHQKPINGMLLRVEYARRKGKWSSEQYSKGDITPEKGANQSSHNTTFESLDRLNAFVSQMNATSGVLSQPPPAHLCYGYPKVNRSIVDAIGIALETTPRFYTQVLHLMNRMNLEPPFVASDKHLQYPKRHREVAVQTTKCGVERLVASDESELESDDDTETYSITKKRSFVGPRLPEMSKKNCSKRPNMEDEANPDSRHKQHRKRFRAVLQQQQQQQLPVHTVKEDRDTREMIFESKIGPLKGSVPIRIIVDTSEDSMKNSNLNSVGPTVSSDPLLDSSCNVSHEIIKSAEIDQSLVSQSTSEPPPFTLATLHTERIPSDQLSGHILFENYVTGPPSHKLYIKNIGKRVTDAQLQQIFTLFLDDQSTFGATLDVRLMKTGRMKGQAFVTYVPGAYQTEADMLAICTRARAETNGLILDGRPIVVAFGKSNASS